MVFLQNLVYSSSVCLITARLTDIWVDVGLGSVREWGCWARPVVVSGEGPSWAEGCSCKIIIHNVVTELCVCYGVAVLNKG